MRRPDSQSFQARGAIRSLPSTTSTHSLRSVLSAALSRFGLASDQQVTRDLAPQPRIRGPCNHAKRSAGTCRRRPPHGTQCIEKKRSDDSTPRSTPGEHAVHRTIREDTVVLSSLEATCAPKVWTTREEEVDENVEGSFRQGMSIEKRPIDLRGQRLSRHAPPSQWSRRSLQREGSWQFGW